MKEEEIHTAVAYKFLEKDPPVQYPQLDTFEDRKREMLLHKWKIERRLENINKIKKRWNTGNKVVKYSGYSLSVILASAATALGAISTGGLLIPPIVLTIIASGSVFQTGLTAFLTEKITGRELNKIRRKELLIKSLLNKLYIYLEKASGDGEITTNELEEFLKIVEQHSPVLSKTPSEILDNTLVNKRELRKIKKEVKKEVKEKQINDIKNTLQRNYSIQDLPRQELPRQDFVDYPSAPTL